MERLSALSRGMQLMLAAGVLLLIDSFLNWQEYSASLGGLSVSASRSGWHGWGLLAGLLTILLLLWLVARVAGANIQLPVSETMVGAVLGALILLFTLLKVLSDSDFRTKWAWVGLVLAVLVAVGAWLEVMAGGGVQTLRTEASGMRTGGGTGAGSGRTPPPPAPPPTPPPPPAEESRPPGEGGP